MALHRDPGFLGRGIAFPPRLNHRTGGFLVSEGNYNSASVAVQYLAERFTIDKPIHEIVNHISESIYHILFTSLLQHETLPPFGSKVMNVLFEPSTEEFRLLFSSYLRFSTWRWEKRARYPEKGGLTWIVDGLMTDRGEAPLKAQVEFLTVQRPDNLVQPFITERQARLQEYPSSVIDTNLHDLPSRYYGQTTTYGANDFSYIRLRNNPIRIDPASDDSFYEVKPLDTWYLISWYAYSDVRYWYYPFLAYMQDRVGDGATRDMMNPDVEPIPGDVIRMPSPQHLLLLQSRRNS